MFWSAESLVFLIAIFFIKNKWEADVRCVARSTVKSDQFEVARSVCQYAIYCNSFVCSTICPMTKRDNDFPGIFAKDQRSEIWCLKDDSCERWNVRHHPSDLSQAGIGKHWTPCFDNFLFRTTWANFSLLVSMVSMVFRVGFVQNFAFPVVLPDLFWLVLYVFSSHDVADQMCQEPIALVPWVVVWPSSNRICYVLELSFEFEDVWSAAFFKCSWNRGEKRLSLAKNSQLTGEDIYWHFCMSADVFSMSLMYTYYTYIYIYTYYLLYCAQVCFLVLKLHSLNDVAKWKMKKQFSFEVSWRFVHALFLSQSFNFFLIFKQPFWLPFLMAFFKSE